MKEKERQAIVEEIKRELRNLSDGSISVSPYDTAFVARLESSDKVPLFPECLDWLLKNQLPDGSWGSPDVEYYFERIICTMAALYSITKWQPDHLSIDRGVAYLNNTFPKLNFSYYATVGFELVFPTLYRQLVSFGLKLNADEVLINMLEAKVQKKLSMLDIYSHNSTLMHSLEYLIGKDVDFTKLMKHQETNGSFGCSPASTAFVYENTGDKTAELYLANVVKKYNGAIPPLYPIDIFERNWIVNGLIDMDLADSFGKELEPIVDYLDQSWTKDGVGFSRQYAIPDIDNSTVLFRTLKKFNKPKDLSFIKFFESEDGFYCYRGELDTSPTHNASLVKMLSELDQTEESDRLLVKAIRALEESLGKNYLDKWHVSPYYTYSRLIIENNHFKKLRNDIKNTILEKQAADGGWGYFDSTTAEETALASIALLRSNSNSSKEVREALSRAYKYLSRNDKIPRLWIGKSLFTTAITKFNILQAKLAIINFLEHTM